METLKDEFQRRGVKVAALSCNDTKTHAVWGKDIVAINQCKGPGLWFPVLADPRRELAQRLGMLDEVVTNCRAVFIIGPDRKLKLSMLYPATTGRNLGEVLRVLDSLQLAAAHQVATPANWKGGDKVLVVPSLSTAEARGRFPKGVEVAKLPSDKEYMRFTPDPR